MPDGSVEGINIAMEGIDVREMSFQNVLDTILKPAGVKVRPNEVL